MHDDTDALLEGYAEPRQAAAHSPEWIVSMQDTLHISHALIPNSHEFEFVVTLANEVIRFHAMSWYDAHYYLTNARNVMNYTFQSDEHTAVFCIHYMTRCLHS